MTLAHTHTQLIFMISTVNCIESWRLNGLSLKIMGKGDSLTLQETFKITAEGWNRVYSFKDYLHVNSVLWITEFI